MTFHKEIETISNISAANSLSTNIQQIDKSCGHVPACGSFYEREISALADYKTMNVEAKFFCNPLRVKLASIDNSKSVCVSPSEQIENHVALDIWSPYTRDFGKQVQAIKYSIKSSLKNLTADEIGTLKRSLFETFRPVFSEKSLTNDQKRALESSILSVFFKIIQPAHFNKFCSHVSWTIVNMDPRVLYGVLINVLEMKATDSEAKLSRSGLQNRATFNCSR